jgi:hypothetical protein
MGLVLAEAARKTLRKRTDTFCRKESSMAAPGLSKEQWKALPAQRKKRDAKGVRFIKVKEGEGEKLVEVRVFSHADQIKEPVPAEWLA